MSGIRTDLAEPVPVAEPPAARRLGPRAWARENLFNTWYNGVLTVVAGTALAWLLYRAARFVFVTARWEIVRRNLANFMVSFFPRDQLWRPWAAMFLLVAVISFRSGVAGAVLRRQVRRGGEPRGPFYALQRIWPLVLLGVVLVILSGSWQTAGLLAALGVTAAGFRAAGDRLPTRFARWASVAAVAGVVSAVLVVSQFGGVGWEGWRGLMLTVFLAVAGILLSFPLGVALALGRRSRLPAVCAACVGYIELIRGVPLVTLLFMSAFVLGFFLPPGTAAPSLVTRALVALVLFTAGYVAEIVRGGLQSVPRGQVEAAAALGLSPSSTARRIVLPQALRAVIPALVGQFITLFKDTSLVVIIGLTDLLGVARQVTKQPDFLGQALHTETLVFASFVYWAGAYWMSSASRRLERRLGVGER